MMKGNIYDDCTTLRINISGQKVYILPFADGLALISENENDLERFIKIVDKN